MRAEQKANKQPLRYDGRWRDRDPAEGGNAPYVIRLKAPREGAVTIEDHVQGPVTVNNGELDDLVLLRSDGTPTYMLAVVVDDHDMGVTHVIRGDDHLNNAFRQLPIYRAMNAIEGGWEEPEYAHIPLIFNPDGTKMSKRKNAVAVDEYRDQLGILPEALSNYLLRLGWGHGDDEIISREQAIEWFELSGVGKSPSPLIVSIASKILSVFLLTSSSTFFTAESDTSSGLMPLINSSNLTPSELIARRSMDMPLLYCSARMRSISRSALFFI